MASQPADTVPITSLGPQQLARVRDQLAGDVDDLVDSHVQLGRLAARSSSAARAVETLADSKTGDRTSVCYRRMRTLAACSCIRHDYSHLFRMRLQQHIGCAGACSTAVV